MENATDRIAALKGLRSLAGLDREDLEDILRTGQPGVVRGGKPLVERGDPGEAMYILLSGTARWMWEDGSTGSSRGTSSER